MSEIEKQFFEAFGIELRIMTEPRYSLNSEYYEVAVKNYPQITDRILLELICILTAWHLDEREPYEVTGYNMECLKRQILEDCISLQYIEKFKNKVQALFKEV